MLVGLALVALRGPFLARSLVAVHVPAAVVAAIVPTASSGTLVAWTAVAVVNAWISAAMAWHAPCDTLRLVRNGVVVGDVPGGPGCDTALVLVRIGSNTMAAINVLLLLVLLVNVTNTILKTRRHWEETRRHTVDPSSFRFPWSLNPVDRAKSDPSDPTHPSFVDGPLVINVLVVAAASVVAARSALAIDVGPFPATAWLLWGYVWADGCYVHPDRAWGWWCAQGAAALWGAFGHGLRPCAVDAGWTGPHGTTSCRRVVLVTRVLGLLACVATGYRYMGTVRPRAPP